jgi:hypothetical protein
LYLFFFATTEPLFFSSFILTGPLKDFSVPVLFLNFLHHPPSFVQNKTEEKLTPEQINLTGGMCVKFQKTSVVDPGSLNPDPDPAFKVNPDPDPRYFFLKNCNLLIPRPP